MRLIVMGCLGRMGKRITHLALQDKDFNIVGLTEHKDFVLSHKDIEGISISTSLEELPSTDVLIDFTSPDSTLGNIRYCLDKNIKMVIGTTGLDENQISQISEASKSIPIVFSSNMSVGVNLLFNLLEYISKKIPLSYSTKIIEAHHVHKKDAPSGTAKTLAEIIQTYSKHKISDIQSVREGEIVGDHEIVFESQEDILSIKHHAKSRDIFAKGALLAAKYLQQKSSGLFHMKDVLSLSDETLGVN